MYIQAMGQTDNSYRVTRVHNKHGLKHNLHIIPELNFKMALKITCIQPVFRLHVADHVTVV